PSAKSGMAPGDEILSINGYMVDRLEMEQLVALLTQSRQQPARLAVRRPGSARILDLLLIPEEMQSPSVERTFLLRPGIGYVRVSGSDEQPAKQIKEGTEKLGGAGLKGLFLDLRNNPGALLPAAPRPASLFLAPGQKLLPVRAPKVEEQEKKVPASNTP